MIDPQKQVVDTPNHRTRCLIFAGTDAARALSDPSEISEILKHDHTIVWFDLTQPRARDLELLREEFDLHPMAIEDAALTHERPKIDTYDRYMLLVVHGAILDAHGRLQIGELAIFVGRNFVVTIRTEPFFPLDEIERRWHAKWGPIPRDPFGLLYVILDTVVDSYYPVTNLYEERFEFIETHLFDEGRRSTEMLQEIFAFKRDLQRFKRAAGPMRDILQTILRGDIQTIEPPVIAYFRDVYDHALRVSDQIESHRELTNSALDVHLSSQSQKQGDVSKQLTIIATIFLPLTYLTGFFGQNFGQLVSFIAPAWTFWWLGIGGQIITLVCLLAYFRYKRWF
ncbi:MAG: magnesium transporter CorA family protein [Candidatus Velthaea sp.]